MHNQKPGWWERKQHPPVPSTPQLPAFLPQGMGCVLGQGWCGALLAISAEAGAGEPLGKHAGAQHSLCRGQASGTALP